MLRQYNSQNDDLLRLTNQYHANSWPEVQNSQPLKELLRSQTVAEGLPNAINHPYSARLDARDHLLPPSPFDPLSLRIDHGHNSLLGIELKFTRRVNLRILPGQTPCTLTRTQLDDASAARGGINLPTGVVRHAFIDSTRSSGIYDLVNLKISWRRPFSRSCQ